MSRTTSPVVKGERGRLWAAVAPRLQELLFSPVTFALAAGLAVAVVILLATGANPLTAISALFVGAFGEDGISDTISQAIPIVGLAIALAIPLRAGLVNLGGEGQLVLGAMAAVVTGLYSPFPGFVTLVLALLAGMVAGGLYACIAAIGEIKFGVPLLVTSLLLSYPAMSFASYLVRHPLREEGSALPQTQRVPAEAHLASFDIGPAHISVGAVLVLVVIVLFTVSDARTPSGYEVRMTGLGPRFAAYSGVNRNRLTLRLLFISGSLAGMVGAILMLGFPYRFIDGALITPAYVWTGLMAALLAAAAPVGTAIAAAFFAALSVGGFGMERATDVPRELSAVLQAVIIVFLAARTGMFRRRRQRDTANGDED